MRRAGLGALIFIFIVSFGGVAATTAAGWSPQLGLDLQGGASVVLQPNRDVPSGILNQSIAIIRNRVDALGVAEPDITRLGDTIVVQLPGVRDQDRALDVVGQTAELRFRPVLQILPPEGETDATTTTTAPTTTTTGETTETTAAADATTTTTTPGATTTTAIPGTTPRDEDVREATVVLPELGEDGEVIARYQLGPAELTGRAVDTAIARAPIGLGADWAVDVEFTGRGSREFDEVASKCFQGTPECPTRQLAIVLDGVVQSAPQIQAQEFGGTAQITGNFSEREAKDLALVLRFGALPVQLEPQEVRTVSATLGQDSLKAGIAAGIGGLALVLAYMIVYYRALGVVVVLGLIVWGGLQWTIISFLGEQYGLALTLAGAVGIVVSVGVTADSYIVYFERLKDEIRSGKTIRSSVDRGFRGAYRTIVTADVASLIGALLLYFLTVGPVRGFALFLGISTVLDLVVAWFFTRPMVGMLARSRVFTDMPWLGVARGLAARPAGEAV